MKLLVTTIQELSDTVALEEYYQHLCHTNRAHIADTLRATGKAEHCGADGRSEWKTTFELIKEEETH